MNLGGHVHGGEMDDAVKANAGGCIVAFAHPGLNPS